MKKYCFDAVIIGTGCAGYNCADWLYDFGVTDIAIVTEGINKGTSRNTGSDKQTYYKLSLSGDEGDSVYRMAKTLFDGGAMDGDLAISEAANSVRSFIKLNNLGVNFPTNEYGEFVGYKTDHDPCQRGTSIGPYTSKKMTEALQKSVEGKGITTLNRLQAIEILKEGDRAVGVMALDLDSEELAFIEAKFVVMATGGPASAYYDSVYPKGHTGSSSLALNAGAEMRNLAEWQYGLASTDFRWNVSGTYQQVLPRYISVDSEGVEREFLLDYFSDPYAALKNEFLKGYEWPFDVRKIHGSSFIDLIVYNETAVLNRTVYMDFTREPTGLESGFDGLDPVAKEYLQNSDALIATPIARLKKMNPGAISLYADHGIDITKEPLKIAVCAQHNNGGVAIDKNYQSTVSGLYVIGEAAGSLGIFRPGGSALNSCQVGGLCAAKHIAYEAERYECADFDAVVREATERVNAFIESCKGTDSTLKESRERMQKRMSKHFAFLRDESAMKSALAEIEAELLFFTRRNKWAKKTDLSALFKNYDIARMQQAIGSAILYTAERFGSRGSGMVTDGPFMERTINPEDESGRAKAVTVKHDYRLTVYEKDIRPLPERNLWFEKVWAEHRAKTEAKQ